MCAVKTVVFTYSHFGDVFDVTVDISVFIVRHPLRGVFHTNNLKERVELAQATKNSLGCILGEITFILQCFEFPFQWVIAFTFQMVVLLFSICALSLFGSRS